MILKERLDVILVSRGFFTGRDRAKVAVSAGEIFVNGKKAEKASEKYETDADIEFRGEKMKYVSRGGFKLERAAEVFGISLEDSVCMDIGASTGGFTDCMLKYGAKKVYAVDVGCGQLADSLIDNPRVINMEKTNIRYIERLSDEMDFASVDVSFISLKHVLPALKRVLKADGESVCLIKPQFEAGKGQIGKSGVVKDPNVHKTVIGNVLSMAKENGFGIRGLTYSPIKGPMGNIEYLMYIKNNSEDTVFSVPDTVVSEAHEILNRKGLY